MAVDVHGVRNKELVLDDEVNPFILLGEGDGIADGVVGSAGKGLQGWVVEIDVDDRIVEEPLEDGTIVVGGDRGQSTAGDGRLGTLEGGQRTGGLYVVGHQACKGLVLADGSSHVGNTGLGQRGSSRVGTFVGDDRVSDTESRVGTSRGAGGLEDSTDVVLVNRLISLQDDIVTLAVGNLDRVGLVWLDGDEIGSDDGDGVFIKANDERVLGSTATALAMDGSARDRGYEPVDDTEEMLLSWLDSPAERFARLSIGALVLAVEEGVEAATGSEVGNSGGLSGSRNCESKSVRDYSTQGCRPGDLRIVQH